MIDKEISNQFKDSWSCAVIGSHNALEHQVLIHPRTKTLPSVIRDMHETEVYLLKLVMD